MRCGELNGGVFNRDVKKTHACMGCVRLGGSKREVLMVWWLGA